MSTSTPSDLLTKIHTDFNILLEWAAEYVKIGEIALSASKGHTKALFTLTIEYCESYATLIAAQDLDTRVQYELYLSRLKGEAATMLAMLDRYQ